MITTITLNPAIDRRYFIETLDTSEVVRCNDYAFYAGGKGINVSKVLYQLGVPIQCKGFLGGETGIFIEEFLRKLGVDTSFTQIQGSTRSCLSIITKDGRQFEIVETGPVISNEEKEKFLSTFEERLIENSIIVLSGSLPKDLPTTFYKKLIERANKKRIKVILDTSGEALQHGLLAKPYLIKPNVEEMSKLLNKNFEGEEELLKGTVELLKLGAENVALSLGEKGMIFSSKDASYRVYIPTIKAKNSVGSGDSTVAGFAYALNKGMKIEDMLKTANACGMSNAMMVDIGCIDPQNLKNLMKDIKIIRIGGGQDD